MLRQTIAALAVATIALISTPTAAIADPYVSGSTVTSDRYVIEPGGTFTVTWHDDYFCDNDPVTVGLSGKASVQTTILTSTTTVVGSSANTVTDANGSVVTTFTVSKDALGNYPVTGTSECGTGGVTVKVVESGVAGAQVVAARKPVAATRLASTGADIPMVLLVSGGGALVFGAILLGTRARSRRNQED